MTGTSSATGNCRTTQVHWELFPEKMESEVSLQKAQSGRLERDGSRHLQGGDPTMAMTGPCESRYSNERGRTEGEDEDAVRVPGTTVGWF